MAEADYLRSLAILAGLIAVLGIAALLLHRLNLRRLVAPGAKRTLETLETRWIDSRTRLLVVRWHATDHLLLVSGQAATMISSRTADHAPAAAVPDGAHP
jgi:flagellar biogenesis protein FliO